MLAWRKCTPVLLSQFRFSEAQLDPPLITASTFEGSLGGSPSSTVEVQVESPVLSCISHQALKGFLPYRAVFLEFSLQGQMLCSKVRDCVPVSLLPHVLSVGTWMLGLRA